MNDNNQKPDSLDRRDFIKIGAAAGLGAALSGMNLTSCSKHPKSPPTRIQSDPVDPVRIGYVGVGGMGSAHIRNLLRIEGAEISAVCDIVPEKVKRIQKWVEDAGQPKPEGYTLGEYDFERLCEREDLDLVYTATPWKWHVPVCIAAMKAGKHAATEVPAAITIEECWNLVETSEKTGKHCIMMENCCYGHGELTLLNMVRQGLLGEIIHGECGYLHDLRGVKFSNKGEGLWRLQHSIARNANLYPTHGLGPVAQCMNINRGDQFDYLVSMSSVSRGLNLYAENTISPDHKKATQKYALGDINVSLIRTVKGRTITLYHDCSSPRPYSRINLVQGTKGIHQGYPDKIHIEGRSPGHGWEPMKNYYEEFDHPLWKTLVTQAKGAGHGGMDFIEDYRLIQCLRTGTYPDMDVYDAAAWSVVIELSEQSVAKKSRPVDFPDFTRGAWKTWTPLGIVEA
ncbi:Gfo/Idh/MocA family oxidoreductase [bacterium]|nr:Gfo/Idh/MocA family oxidoreductase [bacterium]